MSKSILVIDTPNYCSECPLCYEDRQTYRDCCNVNGYPIFTSDKPDWCPLIPLTEKHEIYKSKYNGILSPVILGELT